MEKKIKQVDPHCLYPVEKIEHIKPQELEAVVERMKYGDTPGVVKVICYDGYYFILNGHYEVLAANILNRTSIDVEIVDRFTLDFWNNDDNLLNQLKSIGINALYDFESVGFFKYEMYPSYYEGGE